MTEQNKNLSISVFFPCYNDRGTIATMVLEAEAILKQLTDDFEIIVVDDGSTDGSRELLKNLTSKCPELKLVFHEKNRGYGGALRSGFKNANKDLVFYTDGDAQYDVRELKKIVDKFEETKADWINGYKIKRADPFHRVLIGKIYKYLMKILFGLEVQDCNSALILDLVLERKIEDTNEWRGRVKEKDF